jgi:hypothetical protein
MTSVEDAFSHDHAKSCVGYSNLYSLARTWSPLQCTTTNERSFEYIAFLTPRDLARFCSRLAADLRCRSQRTNWRMLVDKQAKEYSLFKRRKYIMQHRMLLGWIQWQTESKSDRSLVVSWPSQCDGLLLLDGNNSLLTAASMSIKFPCIKHCTREQLHAASLLFWFWQ